MNLHAYTHLLLSCDVNKRSCHRQVASMSRIDNGGDDMWIMSQHVGHRLYECVYALLNLEAEARRQVDDRRRQRARIGVAHCFDRGLGEHYHGRSRRINSGGQP